MRKKSSSATAKKATPKTRTIVTRGSSTERSSSSKTKQKESIIFEGLPKSVLSGKNCLVCKELFVNIDMNFVQCTFCQQNVHLKCCMSAELFESFSEFQNKIDNINLFSGKIGYSCENCSKIASPTVADMSTQSDPDTGFKENDQKESHENKNEDSVQEISTSQTILKENTEMEKNRVKRKFAVFTKEAPVDTVVMVKRAWMEKFAVFHIRENVTASVSLEQARWEAVLTLLANFYIPSSVHRL